jgi:hypothetical protein
MNQPPLQDELEAMAWLYGQSKQIDSMMVEQNKQLVTNSDTIRDQITALARQNRNVRPAPAPIAPPTIAISESPPVATPQIVQHQPAHITTNTQYIPIEKDPDQLEFNLEPSKTDEIIILLRDIKILLGKIVKTQDDKNKSEKKSVSKIP